MAVAFVARPETRLSPFKDLPDDAKKACYPDCGGSPCGRGADAGYDVTGVQPWPDAIIDAPFAVCDENALRQIDARISEYLAWRAKKSMSRHADRLCSRSGAHRCGDQARPRGRHPLRAAALRRPLVRYFLRDRGTAIQ